jgi:hypothetical protein
VGAVSAAQPWRGIRMHKAVGRARSRPGLHARATVHAASALLAPHDGVHDHSGRPCGPSSDERRQARAVRLSRRSRARVEWAAIRRGTDTLAGIQPPAAVGGARAHSSAEERSPYKREATGSNPVAPTRFLQLDGLFETLIGGPVTTAGNHRCMLPYRRGAQGPWQHYLRSRGRVPRRGHRGGCRAGHGGCGE